VPLFWTHGRGRTDPSHDRPQAYIGALFSDDYDLKKAAERVSEFKDLFTNLNRTGRRFHFGLHFCWY
jgi:hypothetical protein